MKLDGTSRDSSLGWLLVVSLWLGWGGRDDQHTWCRVVSYIIGVRLTLVPAISREEGFIVNLNQVLQYQVPVNKILGNRISLPTFITLFLSRAELSYPRLPPSLLST